jgi:hypothetical protein
MKVTLIYAYWPNQPGGATWCDLPWALREACQSVFMKPAMR